MKKLYNVTIQERNGKQYVMSFTSTSLEKALDRVNKRKNKLAVVIHMVTYYKNEYGVMVKNTLVK